MKKLIYILTIVILSVTACKKEMPEPDIDIHRGNFAWSLSYTNKYILTDINTGIYRQDTLWYEVEDTVAYNNFYIKLNLGGKVISVDNYYDAQSANPQVVEQKYFINKIKSFTVTPDCVYNDSVASDNTQLYKYINIFYKNKFGGYYDLSYPRNLYSPIGYTPIKIELSIPPDTNKWVSFTIRITDDKGNAFTTTTDKVFVTK